jgi:hypothetical protein
MFKKTKKTLLSTFLIIFILNITILFSLSMAPDVNAEDLNFKPQITIGDFDKDKEDGYIVAGNTGMIGTYIKSIYEYAIGIVGIVAAAVLMYGGFSYLMSGGSPDKISEAKSWIGASLSGLVLVMLSYLILSIINPKLIDFKINPIEPVDPVKKEDNTSDLIKCWCKGNINTTCTTTEPVDPTNWTESLQLPENCK